MANLPEDAGLRQLVDSVGLLTGKAEGERSEAAAKFREGLLELARREFGPRECGVPCSRLLCRGYDELVRLLTEAEIAPEPPAGARTAWVAAGGYGRRLMSPGSTVRLIHLYDGAEREAAAGSAQAVQETLEQAGIRAACVGHTVPDVLELMNEDYLGAVSLLATRCVCGDEALHRELRRRVEQQFLPACWGALGEEVLAELVARRDPFTGSPYCTEPDLKDSAGCLRDIGALQKLEVSFTALPSLQAHRREPEGGRLLLDSSEWEMLDEALDFILRMRNRLHLLQGDGSDLLLPDLREEVAEALDIEAGEAGGPSAVLMQRLFAHTGGVARLIYTVEERFQHLHRVAWRHAHQPPRRPVGEGLQEVEGRLYSAEEAPFETPEKRRRMMRLFLVSQRRHLPVSHRLLGQVTDALAAVDEEFRRDEEVGREFLDLLAGSVGVADRVAWMRDCGLLQTYLPEFAPLVHRVNPAVGGELTLDEHAVEALRVVDELVRTKEPGELAQRQALEQVERPDLLRLAVLLHDLGSACEDAPATVEEVTERMGLSGRERESVVWLVRNRDLLWQHEESERTGGGELPDRLAEEAGTAERLRTLYLLSYAHGRALGSLGWFAWRDARLLELYQEVMVALVPSYTSFATGEYFDREFRALASAEGLSDEAGRFIELVPEVYKAEARSAEALRHLRMVQKLKDQPAAMSRTVRDREATAWVCTSDVPARFAQIAGVFTHNGLDILSATAFTLEDGTVLDRFVVRMKDRPMNADPTFWGAVENDLARSVGGELDIGRVLSEKKAETAREPISSERLTTAVRFETEIGLPFTALDIAARDRTGLLYDISRSLGELGLNIEFARIRTRGDVARDLFYLTESDTGEPPTEATRLEQVRECLREVTSRSPAAAVPR